MSEIFEGVLCMAPLEKLRPIVQSIASNLSLAIECLDEYALVYRNDPRSNALFTEEVDKFAAQLSSHVGKTLIIRYDSRIGHRSSQLFEDGRLEHSFDAEDEVWVSVDDEGMPITDGQMYKEKELLPDEEYETIQNAIELGIQQMPQLITWQDILEFITKR